MGDIHQLLMVIAGGSEHPSPSTEQSPVIEHIKRSTGFRNNTDANSTQCRCYHLSVQSSTSSRSPAPRTSRPSGRRCFLGVATRHHEVTVILSLPAWPAMEIGVFEFNGFTFLGSMKRLILGEVRCCVTCSTVIELLMDNFVLFRSFCFHSLHSMPSSLEISLSSNFVL